MNPQTPPAQNINNPLDTGVPGEQVICEIKRHPFGLIGMYIMAGILVIVLGLATIFVPHFFPSISNQIKLLMLLGFAIIAAFVFLLVFVATSIYNKNRWILTNANITEVAQEGLFRRQISQLSLANLEDITTDQSNVIQSLFHFGTLRAETAGETSHFTLNFCPNPNQYAQKILMARDEFLRNSPDAASHANDKLAAPAIPAAPTPPSDSTPSAPNAVSNGQVPLPESNNYQTPPPQ